MVSSSCTVVSGVESVYSETTSQRPRTGVSGPLRSSGGEQCAHRSLSFTAVGSLRKGNQGRNETILGPKGICVLEGEGQWIWKQRKEAGGNRTARRFVQVGAPLLCRGCFSIPAAPEAAGAERREKGYQLFLVQNLRTCLIRVSSVPCNIRNVPSRKAGPGLGFQSRIRCERRRDVFP